MERGKIVKVYSTHHLNTNYENIKLNLGRFNSHKKVACKKLEEDGNRDFKGTWPSRAIKIYGGCNYTALQTGDRKSPRMVILQLVQ